MTPQPTLRRLAAWHYQQLRPMAPNDGLYGWPVAHFCAAYWGPVEDLYELVRDKEDGTLGWALLYDVDRVPAVFLPHLAQRVGVRVPANTPEATVRRWIKDVRGWKRATIRAMIADIKPTLTGTQYVFVLERPGGQTHGITFFTRTAETPNPAATLAAAFDPERRRIGLQITHVVTPYKTWRESQAVDTQMRTWAEFQVLHPTTTWAQGQADGFEVDS